MRPGEFVGGRPHVHARVVQHEVFDVDELAFEQERGAGVGEMGPGDPAIADRARSQPLVETGERVLGTRKRQRDLGPGEQAEGAGGRHRGRAFRRRKSVTGDFAATFAS